MGNTREDCVLGRVEESLRKVMGLSENNDSNFSEYKSRKDSSFVVKVEYFLCRYYSLARLSKRLVNFDIAEKIFSCIS